MSQELREFLHVTAYLVSLYALWKKCVIDSYCSIVIEQYSLLKPPHGLINVYKLPTVFALHTSPQTPLQKKVTYTAQIA